MKKLNVDTKTLLEVLFFCVAAAVAYVLIVNSPKQARVVSSPDKTDRVAGSPAKTDRAGYPTAQTLFMDAISSYRDRYITEKNKEFYIDQKVVLEKIVIERNGRLNFLIKNNRVERWVGKIHDMYLTQDGSVSLKVELYCGSLFWSDSDIPPGTLLFQKLKAYQVGDEIIFTGSFVSSSPEHIDRNEVLFSEMSFTQLGSMERPDILFNFTSFH